MFSDPQSQPLWAISDPEKYLSLKHMQDCGYFYIPSPKGEQDPAEPLCTGRWNSEGQLIFDCPYARLGGANTNPVNAWSQEWPWMTKLPWWEMHRVAQVPYCTSEDLRRTAFNTFFENVKKGEKFNGMGWISGCMRLDGPADSCRAVFSLYDLDREKSGDPAAEQYVEYNGKKMYYKVLPFYFHSPQHQNHRVTAAFVSAKPLTIEPVVV